MSFNGCHFASRIFLFVCLSYQVLCEAFYPNHHISTIHSDVYKSSLILNIYCTQTKYVPLFSSLTQLLVKIPQRNANNEAHKQNHAPLFSFVDKLLVIIPQLNRNNEVHITVTIFFTATIIPTTALVGKQEYLSEIFY